MSTVNLMLLGALLEKPMNAYEMKKMVENRNLKYWVKLSSPAIYKNLLKLHEKGYLDSETVREGEMPEKKIYTINDRGRLYFSTLMKRYAEKPGIPYIDFTAFVANLHNVDHETAMQLIGTLKNQLGQARKLMDSKMGGRANVPPGGRAVMDLYQDMYKEFYDWTVELEKDFKQRG